MKRTLLAVAVATILGAAPVSAAGITGKYIEARTCDVYVAPCVANAEMNLTGKHAVLGWKVDKGSLDGVKLDGLSIVAVVAASDTLGMKQTRPAEAVLIVDGKASSQQRAALIHLAKREAGDLVKHVISVKTAPIDLNLGHCKGGSCASLKAGDLATVETRCLDGDHDKTCGNEGAFYPPLAKDAKARVAVAVEHSFQGKDFNETWQHADRRAAYVGSFETH